MVIPVFTASMPAKLSQVQLRRHAGGKVACEQALHLGKRSEPRRPLAASPLARPNRRACSQASGKARRWLLLPAAHVLIRPGSSPDGTGGYVANTSAAYENQAYYCKDNHYEFNESFRAELPLEIVSRKKTKCPTYFCYLHDRLKFRPNYCFSFSLYEFSFNVSFLLMLKIRFEIILTSG